MPAPCLAALAGLCRNRAAELQVPSTTPHMLQTHILVSQHFRVHQRHPHKHLHQEAGNAGVSR